MQARFLLKKACVLLSVSTTILFCFSTVRVAHGYVVTEHTQGQVAGGSANYYSTVPPPPGLIIILLVTDAGDADLYVARSSTTTHPSNDLYEFTSASFGVETVVVSTSEKVSIGVFGHVRHDNTSYRLYIVVPQKEDISRYQVRESDPETGREEIVIDADPLALLNDPELQDLLTGSATGSSADEPSLGKLVEWVGWIMLKILELAAEVLM